MSQGKFREAKDEFETAVELQPQNAEAQAGLGMALRSLGLTDQAEVHLKRAHEIDPRNY